MRKTAVTILMLCVPVFAAYAQTFSQYLYWLRYQNQLVFSKQWYWNNEIDNRRFLNPDVQHQLIIHSLLHYRTASDRWDLAAGSTYSVAYASRPEIGYQQSLAEFRPVVEASYEVPFRNLQIQQRMRIDTRFFQADPEQSVFSESVNVIRYRYRLQIRMPLKVNEDKITVSSIRIAEEIMLNSKRNTFDQNRVYATVDYLISKNFSLEAGYIYIYQQRYGQDEFFKRHVFRFSLLHKIFMH